MKILVKKQALGCSATMVKNDYEAKEGELLIAVEDKPNSMPECWDIIDGSLVEDVTKAKEDNEKRQYQSALDRQLELGIDFNFVALITGILSAHAIAGTEAGHKVLACRDGLDFLWHEKDRRVDRGDTSTDYLGVGSKPYSYDEVRSEAEGA